MQWIPEKAVSDLFEKWAGTRPAQCTPLPPSGSNRRYFRLQGAGQTVIGAFNPDPRENRAFLDLSRHFLKKGLPVPGVLAEERDAHCYLLTDLGDTTLFSLLPRHRGPAGLGPDVMGLYRQAIEWLPRFQSDGAEGLDFGVCYPRHAFDRHSMMWDLNYFKYYFLKISGVPFDEQLLEDDFERFADKLAEEPSGYFMYRDFQSRNIMVAEGSTWFIDYQGGRRGPLQYDLASLLFDAKADIPFGQRMELMDHYAAVAGRLPGFEEKRFRAGFYDFVVMRILQALGTYGFRGGVERKPLFLQSVPYALNNLRWLEDNGLLPGHVPYLSDIVRQIAALPPGGVLPGMEEAGTVSPPKDPPPPGGTAPATENEAARADKAGGPLKVRICSFSYKKGLPEDDSGHGGGFVFDCRALPNPGRDERLKHYNGKDDPVRAFLENEPAVAAFVAAASRLVEQAVENYLSRGFRNLTVAFGCTGGQHRSVYCAERLARELASRYPVGIDLYHREAGSWQGNGPAGNGQADGQQESVRR